MKTIIANISNGEQIEIDGVLLTDFARPGLGRELRNHKMGVEVVKAVFEEEARELKIYIENDPNYRRPTENWVN